MNIHSVEAAAGRDRSISRPSSGDSEERRRLRTRGAMQRGWPELASWRRMLLRLLGAPLSHPMGEGSGVRAMESGERARLRAVVLVHLSVNRPTPDPSQEGNKHSSASTLFPSWEGLGVGSWSQCMCKSERRLSMNRWLSILPAALLAGCAPFESRPISPTETAARLDARRLDD